MTARSFSVSRLSLPVTEVVVRWLARGLAAATEAPDTPGEQADRHGGAGHGGQALHDHGAHEAQQVQVLVLVLDVDGLHGLRCGLHGLRCGRRRG